MARIRRLDLPWHLCWSKDPTTPQFNPLQLWVRAADLKLIRVGWEALSETQTGCVSYPAYQVADVESTIVSTTVIGSGTGANILTGVGVLFPWGMTDVSATSQAHQLFRLGMYLKTASGQTPQFTHIRAWLEWEDC